MPLPDLAGRLGREGMRTLSFENTDLVAEHDDLDVLVRFRAQRRHDEAEDPRQADAEK
jgi:hypothetical protein